MQSTVIESDGIHFISLHALKREQRAVHNSVKICIHVGHTVLFYDHHAEVAENVVVLIAAQPELVDLFLDHFKTRA